MTLTCKPIGSGNWNVVTIQINLPNDLFRLQTGQRISFGDLVLRIIKVAP